MGVGASRDDIKRRVHEATDLVRLVSEHVVLRARGREFVGLCPFHDDKNPSMAVVPHKGIFHCFACGTGGDAFNFVMKYHKMSFPEALAYLAERANIKLPRYTGGGGGTGDPDEPSPRQRIMQVNANALDYYRRCLRDPKLGAAARAYIAKRSISPEMVELFQLGAAPDEWDALSREAGAKRWDLAAVEQAGLIAKREGRDGHYDKLRHRLIFPILDNVGRPIAFGGRIMPDSTRDDQSDAKYLNSPETPAFNKSTTLYGIHAAQKPIIDARTAIIVEGYIDVIACHQAGVRNAVATLGTALTAEHAKVLRRYCDKVVLVFDGDEAGQKAADRAIGVFFTETLDVSIAVIPGGKDPADLLFEPGGREAWDAAMEQATDAMSFQFARVGAQYEQADTLTGRQRIAEDFLRRLVQLGIGQLDRQRYGLVFAQVAQLLGMSPGSVAEELRKLTPRAENPQGLPQSPGLSDAPIDKLARAERNLVGALLNRPDLFDAELSDGRPLSETIVPDDFTDTVAREVFHSLSDWLHDHHELHATDFRDAFPDENKLRLALGLQLEADRLVGSKPERLAEQVTHNARAILAERLERDYQRQRLEMRQEPANDAAPDQESRRLDDLRQQLRSHRSDRRRPRVVGSD